MVARPPHESSACLTIFALFELALRILRLVCRKASWVWPQEMRWYICIPQEAWWLWPDPGFRPQLLWISWWLGAESPHGLFEADCSLRSLCWAILQYVRDQFELASCYMDHVRLQCGFPDSFIMDAVQAVWSRLHCIHKSSWPIRVRSNKLHEDIKRSRLMLLPSWSFVPLRSRLLSLFSNWQCRVYMEVLPLYLSLNNPILRSLDCLLVFQR